MSRSYLSAPHFHDEAAATEYVEKRVWPKGPVCSRCGAIQRIGKLQGKSTRIGVWKCYECRKPFSVKIGTIFEDSHVAMHVWLQAIYLIAASKKSISSNQLHRVLGVTLKTAWYMGHRIRLAMAEQQKGKMGEDGGVVKVGETYISRESSADKARAGAGAGHKRPPWLSWNAKAASFRVLHIADDNLRQTLFGNISPKAHPMTGEAGWYWKIRQEFRDIKPHSLIR